MKTHCFHTIAVLKKSSLLGATLASLVLTCSLHAADEWPEWRGPGADGNAPADTKGLPLSWSETENVTWKVKVPGRGYSTPVITGDQIWMTTAFEVKADPADAAKRLEANTGNQPLTVLKKLDLHAVCVDRNTGELIHNIRLLTLEKPQWVHKLNSYASPSPVLRDGRLYCHFGAFGSACVDINDGKLLWTNSELYVMHENGPGSSPVVVGNRMIVHLDGSDAQMVAAFDTDTGKLAWRKERSGEMASNPQQRKACGTPLVVEAGGRVQVVSTGADWLYGYEPQSGEELWKIKYGLLGFSNVARPVAGNDGRVYVPTGFGKGEMMALDLNGIEPVELWRFKKAVPNQPSPLLVDERLYFVSDNGIASCLDAKSGNPLWQQRIGGNFSASPIQAEGRLYLFNREGETVVLEASATFNQLARNQLPGAHMASGVALGGALYLRTDQALYRIEEGGAE